MTTISGTELRELDKLVSAGDYTQFYYDLYRHGSVISGLYIPGPTGQGIFGNYSHEHVREAIGDKRFEEVRGQISYEIANGLLDAIERSGNEANGYRILTDQEFLEEEIRIFTDTLKLPTEAYPGHDLITLKGLAVSGGKFQWDVALGVNGLHGIEALAISMKDFFRYKGQLLTKDELRAIPGLTVDKHGNFYGPDGKVIFSENAFTYKGQLIEESELVNVDGVLFAHVDVLDRMTPVGLTFGKTIELIWKVGSNECFAAGTPILLADGSTKFIENVVVGDLVAAFGSDADSNRGSLVGCRVTRLYRNETSEWLRLDWVEDGTPRCVMTTPGHRFLSSSGEFLQIGSMVRNGLAELVSASGALVQVEVTNMVVGCFSETQHSSEEREGRSRLDAAVQLGTLGDGVTYNFEVETLHTYVAGGLRVHNDSGVLGKLARVGDFLVDTFFGFAPGSFGDEVTDVLFKPLHVMGELITSVWDSVRGFDNPAIKNYWDKPVSNMLAADGEYTPEHRAFVDRVLSTSGGWEPPPGYTVVPNGGGFSIVGDGSDPDVPKGQHLNPKANGTENGGSQSSKPILLDLNGDGITIAEFDKSTIFMDGGDGLQHRTAWAGTGDGVLFYDAGNDNLITEEREYVFTEWNPTASGDLEALRSVWDTNGDGKLTSADAEFAKFKVMVTNADGSTSVQTLAALGITEINLTANTVNIELPDRSVVTGQTTFTRSNGTTGRWTGPPSGASVASAETRSSRGDGRPGALVAGGKQDSAPCLFAWSLPCSVDQFTLIRRFGFPVPREQGNRGLTN